MANFNGKDKELINDNQKEEDKKKLEFNENIKNLE